MPCCLNELSMIPVDQLEAIHASVDKHTVVNTLLVGPVTRILLGLVACFLTQELSHFSIKVLT